MGLGHLVQCAEPVFVLELLLWGQNSGRRAGLSTDVLLKGRWAACSTGLGAKPWHNTVGLCLRVLSPGAICHSTLGRTLLGDTLNESQG